MSAPTLSAKPSKNEPKLSTGSEETALKLACLSPLIAPCSFSWESNQQTMFVQLISQTEKNEGRRLWLLIGRRLIPDVTVLVVNHHQARLSPVGRGRSEVSGTTCPTELTVSVATQNNIVWLLAGPRGLILDHIAVKFPYVLILANLVCAACPLPGYHGDRRSWVKLDVCLFSGLTFLLLRYF